MRLAAACRGLWVRQEPGAARVSCAGPAPAVSRPQEAPILAARDRFPVPLVPGGYARLPGTPAALQEASTGTKFSTVTCCVLPLPL